MSSIILSVHQLNEYVRVMLARDPLLQKLRVRGEISNFKWHSSGHMYFTLKDEQDRIRCVFFKQNSTGLKFQPRDGMRVIAQGAVSLYSRDGQYQMYVDALERDGLGELHLAFEALKQKLREEGLFDQAYKKPLPLFPRKIAIITSNTGAAVRDIIKVIRRRNQGVDLLIVPVAVQGPDAHGQITRAIQYINTRRDIDLIITGRGGGSIEELWAFNEEDVARAIWQSDIPVISAVGHETDFTIADFVADVRAATPSAAGEIAVPETIHLKAVIAGLEKGLRESMAGFLSVKQYQLEMLRNHYVFRTPHLLLNQQNQYVDQLVHRLSSVMRSHLQEKGECLAKTAAALQALSPLSVLARGYALPFLADQNTPVQSIRQVQSGDSIRLTLRDGQLFCTVESSRERSLEQE